MPSERGLPPGQGDGEATAGAAGSEGVPSQGGKSGDGELDKALEDFDGEILAERAIIQARSNETAGNTRLPAELPGSGDPSDSSDLPEGSPAYLPSGIPSERSAPKGPPMGGATAQVPKDIPDARDDDIIARQLREAAINEADPELQEKLWEEYRRYKGA
jgi:hypothetical protein